MTLGIGAWLPIGGFRRVTASEATCRYAPPARPKRVWAWHPPRATSGPRVPRADWFARVFLAAWDGEVLEEFRRVEAGKVRISRQRRVAPSGGPGDATALGVRRPVAALAPQRSGTMPRAQGRMGSWIFGSRVTRRAAAPHIAPRDVSRDEARGSSDHA
jgi:hypothetical protein